jgi:ankyrin repeat protein
MDLPYNGPMTISGHLAPPVHPLNASLIKACEQCNEEAVQRLLDKGCDPMLSNPYGHSLLLVCSMAFGSTSLRVKKSSSEACAMALAQAGADLNVTDAEGNTSLIWAARLDKLALAQHLIGSGARVNVADTWGRTALIWSAATDHSTCAEMLLKAGAALGHLNHRGQDALEVAQQRGGDGNLAWARLMEPYFAVYRERASLCSAAAEPNARGLKIRL